MRPLETARARRRREGRSLLEVALAVSLIGVLAAMFVPTFLREVRTSKTTEAVENLATLHRRAAVYFAARHETDEAEEPLRDCLPPPAGPTPRRPTTEPRSVDFGADDVAGHETWRALGFSPERATRYAYTFEPSAHGCDLRAPEGTYLLTLRAEGDLDGDGIRSIFERRATVNEEGELVPFGELYVRDRVE